MFTSVGSVVVSALQVLASREGVRRQAITFLNRMVASIGDAVLDLVLQVITQKTTFYILVLDYSL